MVVFHYSTETIIVGVVSHSIAILSTVFRLVYRLWTRRFWWEDAWAALAMISDVVCLACIWIDAPISSRTLVVTFTTVLWAARMSVIFSIIRIVKHSVSKVHRQVTYLIAVSFACMWAAIIAQKMSACNPHSCQMGKPVVLSQLITDVVSDASLVIVPLHLWKNVRLSHGRKILVLSAFSSSLLITVVTIPQTITIFRTHIPANIIFAHVKVALSLVICNLLVIITFGYRVYSKETFNVDQSPESNGLFTSVFMVQLSSTSTEMPVSVGEETTSNQIMAVQNGTTKRLKIGDAGVLG